MSHTPGPWHTGNIVGERYVFAADGYAVADATVYHRNHDDQHIANARLIAAAPELLEALETMVAYSDKLIADGHYDYREPRVQELYDMCAAVIAKATGAQVTA